MCWSGWEAEGRDFAPNLRDDHKMDAIVDAALRKWPNVPHCYGWLGCDARGDWYLRDERTQAEGAFPASKGSRIEHAGLREFMARNYARDAAGCWFFQNGPQRVYVELEAAPWVWRVTEAGSRLTLVSHTGIGARFESGWVDENGRLFIAADIGLGLVHSADVELASRAVEHGHWPVKHCEFSALVQRFDYVLSPAAARAHAGL